ncbi:mitochondrial ribosomal protein L54 (mL54) [Andalucia godoyi]|uniref:Large ribosomal subunit protein mL54 n=1 Tax=Andalucia godoyi TaxID=505711 RepID=A0A8K0F100_ANDGO|nr:mitochondrial ribosomal protein L54 (mL54) [Andalucia godoyi]|eukprot:ANDGO_01021.mRNA.1 mitochondrial ribosomal protein L54 (mL54)
MLKRLLFVRSFAAKPSAAAPKASKEGGKSSAAVAPKSTIPGGIPINILKTGQDPVLKGVDQYPDWLQPLGAGLPSLPDLLAQPFDSLLPVTRKRLFKLQNRDKIKKANSLLAKK